MKYRTLDRLLIAYYICYQKYQSVLHPKKLTYQLLKKSDYSKVFLSSISIVIKNIRLLPRQFVFFHTATDYKQ